MTSPANNAPDIGADIDAVIQVEGLSKQYGSRFKLRRKTRTPSGGPAAAGPAAAAMAVNDVSFQVGRGEIFGLIGPDGAGKTSVLQILAGVLRASSGSAMLDGITVTRRPEAVKHLIGYMPQGLGLNLYDNLSVAENIDFFRALRQVPEQDFRANRDQLLGMTRLTPFLDRPAGKLSGGMRQKLALICTLIHLPDILLLDEPTTGVDPISRRDFWIIINELVTQRQTTILMATSYMDEADRCNQIGFMHRGAIIARGTPDDLTEAVTGELWMIRGRDPDALLTALNHRPYVRTAAIHGDLVRATTEIDITGEQLSQDLQSDLTGSGKLTIELAKPNLEDVFIDQIGIADKVAGIQSRAVPHTAELISGPRKEIVGPAITVKEATCRFGDFVAVDNVSLSVKKGEILGLLGPNGAGKTTLIRMLCGLQPPSHGEITVAGIDAVRRRTALPYHTGYMSQQFSLYRDLTVRANLNLVAGLYGLERNQAARRIDSLLDSLALQAHADRMPKALPLGLRQRVALASAMLHQPSVLFLDEPTAGVDPPARQQFWNLVHMLARSSDVAVLISTHFMDEAEHCDRLGFMNAGRLIADDTPSALKSRAEAEKGPLVAFDCAEFAKAFLLLKAHFPNAALYGRRIQWQANDPDGDIAHASHLLAQNNIAASASRQNLSIEQTFLTFMAQDAPGMAQDAPVTAQDSIGNHSQKNTVQ